MSGTTCPYCRAPFEPSEEQLLCEGCETPHHRDCYEENGGCTVFGCRCAPPDEPKLRVSGPEVVQTRLSSGAAPAMAPAAEPAMFSAIVEEDHKGKVNFVILGALLGALGAHNFYAGYRKKALMQLGLTVLTMGYGAPMSWIWAVIDICTVQQDSKGVQFRS
jgi:hypothetical protein